MSVNPRENPPSPWAQNVAPETLLVQRLTPAQVAGQGSWEYQVDYIDERFIAQSNFDCAEGLTGIDEIISKMGSHLGTPLKPNYWSLVDPSGGIFPLTVQFMAQVRVEYIKLFGEGKPNYYP